MHFSVLLTSIFQHKTAAHGRYWPGHTGQESTAFLLKRLEVLHRINKAAATIISQSGETALYWEQNWQTQHSNYPTAKPNINAHTDADGNIDGIGTNSAGSTDSGDGGCGGGTGSCIGEKVVVVVSAQYLTSYSKVRKALRCWSCEITGCWASLLVNLCRATSLNLTNSFSNLSIVRLCFSGNGCIKQKQSWHVYSLQETN